MLNRQYIQPPPMSTAPSKSPVANQPAQQKTTIAAAPTKKEISGAINPVQIKEITSTSCLDPRFPPENILAMGNSKSFWMTTGLYPQWVVVELVKETNVKKVIVTSTGKD